MDTRALAAKASKLITQRNPREAIELLRQVAEDSTCTDPFVHTVYANALMKTGRSWKAAAHLKPLLTTLLARDAVAHATYAKALDNDGRSDEAAAHLKPLLTTLLAGNAVAHNTYAKALDNDGRSDEAAAHLKPLLTTLLAGNAVAHNTYAKALDNDGRSDEAAAHLKPLLTTLLARDAVALTTAAIASINAHHPDDALEFLNQISSVERRGNHLLTYIEAKAHFAAGRMGTTLKLMQGVVGKHSDDAFTVLYLACLEDTNQHVGIYKTALGQSFARLWDKSRQLQSSIHVIAEEERSLFRNNRFWELGAQPINRAAMRELGLLPYGSHQLARLTAR